MTTKIHETTSRFLRGRLEIAQQGLLPPELTKRQFFYKCRQQFQLDWNLDEIDYKGTPTKRYIQWSDMVNTWACDQCKTLDVEPGRFWEVLLKLNINPHERGSCYRRDVYGSPTETMVKHDTKDEITARCSFIIVSEKQSIARQLWQTLEDKGYHVNVIAMGGHNTGTVQSIAADVADTLQEMGNDNFHIVSVHDYDLDGIMMVDELRRWFPSTFDAGLNREFFSHNKIGIDRKISEAVKNKANYSEKPLTHPEYSEEDIEYLHGEKTGPKVWTGNRVEMDAVYAVYGLEPFISYIEHVLEDVPCWDLTRIGIEEQELDEPPNEYDAVIQRQETNAGRAYGRKLNKLSENYNKVLAIVEKALPQPLEYSELVKTHFDTDETNSSRWVATEQTGETYTYYQRPLKEAYPVKEEYSEQISRELKGDYQDELDEEVNDKLECWKGNVTTAENDIQETKTRLQEDLNQAKKEDPELEGFIEALIKVEWGKEALDAIEIPEPAEEVKKVITALVGYIKELEEEGYDE